MAASAVIVHHIPGRARLLVQSMRGAPEHSSNLADGFKRMANVQLAKANPATGSLTLEFLGDLEQVLAEAADMDLLRVAGGARPAQRSRSGAAAAMKGQASNINLVSGREVNPMFMVGSVLTVVGVYQAIRGEWFPPAVAVFWYAAEAFRLAAKSR